jgi:heparan-alpha-glucosaminide N-acetyltransferase
LSTQLVHPIEAPARAERRDTVDTAKVRVVALDAFRGLVMVLMLAEALHLPAVARNFPDNALWRFIAFHTGHVPWEGGSLHDLIQPGFSFLVGAALPFSIAARRARGQSFGNMVAHAAWRALMLILLGIFLRSFGQRQTNFTFEDTLTQIGLGYVFLFLLGFTSVRVQAAALVAILAGYWALFALYPAAGPDFASHWTKNANPAWAFDTWFMNLFPREHPFTGNRGGYVTLSFIPTLGTMILGLLAGEWLRSARSSAEKLRGFIVAGVALIALAAAWHFSGTGPIVKRIWTPSFTLYSGGLVLLILAGFYALTDVKGWRAWAFPLIVVGMNSIAIYVLAHTSEAFFLGAIDRHLLVYTGLTGVFMPVLRGALLLLVLWLILYWMYRRKIFLRI